MNIEKVKIENAVRSKFGPLDHVLVYRTVDGWKVIISRCVSPVTYSVDIEDDKVMLTSEN